MEKTATFSSAKVIFALLLAYGSAIGWVIYADWKYHNAVAIEAVEIHGYYPLFLGLSAVITAYIFDRNASALGLRLGSKAFTGRVLALLFTLYFTPFVLNLITSTVPLNSRPEFNTLFLTLGLPGLLFFALCEEIMWRGLLYREFTKILSPTQTAIAIGLCWALWHYPVIIHTRFIYHDRPLVYALIAFTILVLSASVIYTWLRKQYKSIWPGVLLHALMNFTGFVLIMPLEKNTHVSQWFRADIGVFYVVMMVATAFWAHAKIKQLEKKK